jgi:hypothetical protein
MGIFLFLILCCGGHTQKICKYERYLYGFCPAIDGTRTWTHDHARSALDWHAGVTLLQSQPLHWDAVTQRVLQTGPAAGSRSVLGLPNADVGPLPRQGDTADNSGTSWLSLPSRQYLVLLQLHTTERGVSISCKNNFRKEISFMPFHYKYWI